MQLFDRVQTKDEVLNRVQDRLKSVINAIVGKTIIDGRHLTGLTIPVTTGVSVPHGLGRVPNGWIITNGMHGDSSIGQFKAADAQFLYLVTATLTISGVSIWVF